MANWPELVSIEIFSLPGTAEGTAVTDTVVVDTIDGNGTAEIEDKCILGRTTRFSGLSSRRRAFVSGSPNAGLDDYHTSLR